jgi:hypothetical protein
MNDIPPFDGYLHSFALDVSDSGLVIGNSRLLLNENEASRTFLWQHGQLISLQERLEAGSDVTLLFLNAISPLNVIVGDGVNLTGQVVAVVLTPGAMNNGDVDLNCQVDIDDLLIMVSDWGETVSPADVNHDEIVNIDDFLILINNWTLD